jgi:hypothetical protein
MRDRKQNFRRVFEQQADGGVKTPCKLGITALCAVRFCGRNSMDWSVADPLSRSGRRRRLGLLQTQGPCTTGDHLGFHQQDRNHTLVVETVHEIA